MRIGSYSTSPAAVRLPTTVEAQDRAFAARPVSRVEDKRKDLQKELSQEEEEIQKLQQELGEAADMNFLQQFGNWLFGSAGRSVAGTSPTFESRSARKP